MCFVPKIIVNVIGKARIPTNDPIPKIMRCSNKYSIAISELSESTLTYKCGFFLPDAMISSDEVSDDCFNSLVTARNNSHQSLYLNTESIIF